MDSEVQGVKHDKGKAMWNLLPMGIMAGVVRVLTFGLKKYTKDGWRKVEPDRIYSAMMRHLEYIANGELLDTESGEHHMYHFLTNAIFLTFITVVYKNTRWICEMFNMVNFED